MRTRRITAITSVALSRREVFTGLLGGAAVGVMTTRTVSAGIPLPATELTQILNNIQLVLQYLRQASQLLSMVNQEKMMVTNLIHNGIHSFNDLSGFVSTAAGIAQGGLAIAYSTANMDIAFQKQFPGYASFDQAHPWAKNYLSWAQTNRDTIAGTMRMLNLSGADLASSQALTAAIRSHASGAAGTQQILETMSEFAGAQVNELQGLRALMLADQQSKTSFMAGQQQQADTAAAAQAKFFAKGTPKAPDTRIYDPVSGVH